jgi:hypothetical protein
MLPFKFTGKKQCSAWALNGNAVFLFAHNYIITFYQLGNASLQMNRYLRSAAHRDIELFLFVIVTYLK